LAQKTSAYYAQHHRASGTASINLQRLPWWPLGRQRCQKQPQTPHAPPKIGCGVALCSYLQQNTSPKLAHAMPNIDWSRKLETQRRGCGHSGPQRARKGARGGPAAALRGRGEARRNRCRRRRRKNCYSRDCFSHLGIVQSLLRGRHAHHRGLQLPACRFFARFLVFFAARDGGAARENRKNGRQEILRSSQDGRKKNQARGSCISGEAKRCPSAIFVKILAFAFGGGGGGGGPVPQTASQKRWRQTLQTPAG